MTARGRCLGPFSPSFNITQHLQQGLEKVSVALDRLAQRRRPINRFPLVAQTLPDDAHLLVNGKLHVSVTRVYDGTNIVLRQFDTKEELIQVRHLASWPVVWPVWTSSLLPS